MISTRIVLVLAGTLLAAAPALAQKTMYKYVDANGKTVYTDKPPIEYSGKASEQLNAQGTVIRRNQAALTAEQRAAAEEARKRKVEDDVRAQEEKRKNTALLNTYSSESDIDAARERALKVNEDAIKDTERKIAAAEKRRAQLAAETEFYRNKTLPVQLKRDMQSNENELKAQAELLEAKRRETAIINGKYDEDRRRYVALTTAGKTGSKR
jgi:hypothetical protein